MGSPNSKPEEKIDYCPDPALTTKIEEQGKLIEEQNRKLEEEKQKNSDTSAASKTLKKEMDRLTRERDNLMKAMTTQSNNFREEMKIFTESNSAVANQLKKIQADLAKENIHSLDDLPKAEDARYRKIMELCAQVGKAPIDQTGHNVSFLGDTSVGKSTLINKLMGENVCAVGHGEVTVAMKPYRKAHTNYVYWDMPGKNDKISYLSATYIGTIKGMSFIGIMVRSTTNEMSKMIELMAYLNIKFNVIVNHIDSVEEDEVEAFKAQIRKEMDGNSFCQNIFFISAKKQSGDWLNLVDAITRA